MEYRELVGMAHFHPWALKLKEEADGINAGILAERQRFLDARDGIGVGDIVLDADGKSQRVAHDWGDSVQLTDGRFGSSFYLGDGYVDFSGGLNPGIDKSKFIPTDDRMDLPVWFFSENYVRAHNGYHTRAGFRVWKLEGVFNV